MSSALASRSASTGGMLSALRHTNFRAYFAAQIISNVGTWVQITVENWLVLQLSHSALALGVTNALQFGPSVLFGLYGGLIADRHDRRRLLMLTQGSLAVLALVVGLLVATGIVQVWMIWVAAAALGMIKCFDLPALQGFLKDLVGPADLPNAVAWGNAVSAIGRMVGPVLGGLVVAALGIASGFAINAASFAIVVLTLAMLRADELTPQAAVPRASGQIREVLGYLQTQPALAATVLIMTVVFIAAYNFQISLALIASQMLSGDGRVYGTLMSALGLGAVIGSLILARRTRTGLSTVLVCTSALAATQAALATASGVIALLAAAFAYGVSAGLFSVTVISTLQSGARDDMRGRVMVVYSICFLGSSLVGGPTFGALAGWIGVSGALRVGAGVCAATVLAGVVNRAIQPRLVRANAAWVRRRTARLR